MRVPSSGWWLGATITLLALQACEQEPPLVAEGAVSVHADHPPDPEPPEEPADACDVLATFATTCAECHSAAIGEQGGLDLETDPIGAVVDQPSVTWPGFTLVVPFEPDQSFLLAKIGGRQGREGTPMPPPDGLGYDEKNAMRDWVIGGAPATCDLEVPGG